MTTNDYLNGVYTGFLILTISLVLLVPMSFTGINWLGLIGSIVFACSLWIIVLWFTPEETDNKITAFYIIIAYAVYLLNFEIIGYIGLMFLYWLASNPIFNLGIVLLFFALVVFLSLTFDILKEEEVVNE